jgi:16S rRNA processing protein RimM
MEEMLQVGIIASTHGIRGEVKVFPTTDDVKRFKKLKQVKLDTGMVLQDLEVECVKFFKNMVILKFKGIQSINDIEKYKGKSLYVSRENAVKLEKDEYFIADLIGLSVQLENGERFGTLQDVLQTGANDVYVVDSDAHGQVLLPAVKECILEVQPRAGWIKIRPMKGLWDEDGM